MITLFSSVFESENIFRTNSDSPRAKKKVRTCNGINVKCIKGGEVLEL